MSWPLYGVCTDYYKHKLHWSDMHCAGNIYLPVTLLTKSFHLTVSFVLVFLCSWPCYCFLQLSHRFDMLTHTSLDENGILDFLFSMTQFGGKKCYPFCLEILRIWF